VKIRTWNVDKNERVCVSLLQRLGTLDYGSYLIFILSPVQWYGKLQFLVFREV
jgi:hypothetical protein